jgi:probable F420-dependent oxidoreductase
LTMRYCLQFPNRAAKFLPEWLGDGRFSDFGVFAEEAGFDAVSVYDHPFPEDGWIKYGHLSLDPFVSLAAVAERTERIKLMTNILVAGYRSPYVAAQALATIDRFSNGRMVVGLAAGYLEAEFQALGAVYHGRGAFVDDAIDAMRDAWRGESVERDGGFPAHGHTMFPTPVQQPIPIWIGGNSPRAMRRAAELGDGWLPLSVNEAEAAVSRTPPLATFDHLEEQIAAIGRLREKAGRGPLEVCFAPFERYIKDWSEATIGIAAHRQRYADAGVTWMAIVASARSLRQLHDDVALFADLVISTDPDR